jgi:phosphate starvation-inducible PhoH-like protein
MARRKNLKVEEIIDEIYEPVNFFTQPGNVDKLKVKFKPKTEKQKELIQTIHDKDIVIVNGSPGSGKSYTALAVFLELLKTQKYDKIILTKSVQQLSGEETGFQKGTLDEKLQAVMYSYIINIQKLISREDLSKLKTFRMLDFIPLAFIRGTTFDKSLIICDETQNLELNTVRTMMTRIGEGSKVLFLGDSNQVDNKKLKQNTLETLIKFFKHDEQFGIIEFEDKDILRNPIIKRVETIFKLIEGNTNI